MRKLKILIFMVVVITCILLINQNFVYAESTTNIEYDENNRIYNGKTVVSGELITGVLKSEYDVDYYKYIVDVGDYFNFTLNNTAKVGEVCVTLYDSSYNEVDGFSSRDTYTSHNFNYEKGTVIYIAVITYIDTIDQPYSLVVNAKSDDNWEQENNNESETATIIESNTTRYGIISHYSDVDLYKYTVDKDGYVNFTFKNLSPKRAKWKLKVYDSSFNELNDWLWRDFTEKTYTYNFKVGTVIYFMVYRDDDSVGREYSLTMSATEDSSWENEYNDTENTATEIASNNEMHGNLYSENDVDYYKYTVDVVGYYNFIFTNNSLDDATWNLTVYDESLKELNKWSSKSFTDTSHFYNLKKGSVLYFKIEYEMNGASVHKEYSLLIKTKNSTSWEQEKDDSFTNATSLRMNTTKYGNLYTQGDIDYYTFTATKTGTSKVTFKYDSSYKADGWYVSVYDSSKKLIKKKKILLSIDKDISFKAIKGNKYYIVVKQSNIYSYPLGITYALKIK